MLRRTIFIATFSAVAAITVAACGFKLRGSQSFSFVFQTLAAQFAAGSAVGAEFRRVATGMGLKLIDDPREILKAQAVLDVLQETREKVVVGSLASGQVREFQLRVRFKFLLRTPQGKILIDETEILQQRDFSYAESAALAKESEEQTLYRDMQQDLVQQLMRRLSAVKSL